MRKYLSLSEHAVHPFLRSIWSQHTIKTEHESRTCAFLFPSTGSGVSLLVPKLELSLLSSAKHEAWYIRGPLLIASTHTHSWASSCQIASNFSWHIGQLALASVVSVGIEINCSRGSFLFEIFLSSDCSELPFKVCGGAASSISLNCIHS